MKRDRRIISLVLSLIMLIMALSGCIQAGNDDESEPDMPVSSDTSSSGSDPFGGEVSDDVELPDIIINEVIADNRLTDGTGFNDWVELYNRGDVEVSLDGAHLADTEDKSKWLSLSGKKIGPGEYLLVILDDNAPFHLSSSGETVALLYENHVVDKLTYTDEYGSASFSHEGACEYQTPGFENTYRGYEALLESITLPALRITEVLSTNGKYLPDENGEYHDIVEICNTSSQPISLKGYCLSDKYKELGRYTFPDVTLGAGEYFAVFCSGNSGEKHAPFKISASGETVYLSKDGALIDAIYVPDDIKKDCSYGREGNKFVYMNEPTPGKANKPGMSANLSAPAASVPSGQYSSAQTVTLSGNGTIYYTLDGTHPTRSSKVYTGPINIPEGITTIRTFAYDDGYTSDESAFTYLVGIASHTLPIVTVSIPQDCLFGENGIIDNISSDIEKEGQLTLFEDGEEKFTIPFGFRLHGNDSRKGKKQNFQVRFRSEYGQSKLKYKVFDDLDIDEFKSLLLKGGSEDFPAAMMRDELAAAIVSDGKTNLYYQDYKPVVLYLGGEYWGVYYIRERYSEEYVASHLDVDKDSVDIIAYYGTVQAGSGREYNSLIQFCQTNDLTVAENYKYVSDRVDLISLIDWYACRAYLGDKDYANIRCFRSTDYDGKWRWMWFDLDWAMWHGEDRPFGNLIKNDYKNQLMWPLLKNPEFKDLFIKRTAELMNTVLNEEYILSKIDLIYNAIKPEMEKDRERWGSSMESWERNVNNMRDYVRNGKREKWVLAELKEFFGLTDSQMRSYFGSRYTG